MAANSFIDDTLKEIVAQPKCLKPMQDKQTEVGLKITALDFLKNDIKCEIATFKTEISDLTATCS